MILIPVVCGMDDSIEWSKEEDQRLISAFNRLGRGITAENLVSRKNRLFLVSITDEVSRFTGKTIDAFDVLHRLQQKRKSGELPMLASRHLDK